MSSLFFPLVALMHVMNAKMSGLTLSGGVARHHGPDMTVTDPDRYKAMDQLMRLLVHRCVAYM